MKKENLRIYFIEILLIIFLICAMLFSNVITRKIIAVGLFVFMIISIILLKTDKRTLTNSRQIIILLSGVGIIYIAGIYILGIFTGFYYSTIKLSIWSIINYIIPYIVIIISSEIIRKSILLKEVKISKYLIIIALVLLDVILSTNIYNLTTTNDYFVLISFIIIASIANNMLYNYIIVKYRNVKGIIIYRIITTLYMYIIPITPDIYIFLESVLKMIIPYLIYVLMENLYNKHTEIISVKDRRKEMIINILTCLIVIIIIMLISCKFRVGMLVVGSESMTGTLNKGDAIIYTRYNEGENINTGDVIVFEKDDIKIVHRVEKQRLMGEEIRYYTKGDANKESDEGYIKRENILGKVNFRIPYIGYFTLWVNDFIEGSH